MGFYCEHVSFLKIDAHTFLVLQGNDGTPDMQDLTYYYLLTKNILRRQTVKNDGSFLYTNTRRRFGSKPFASVYIDHTYNSPTASTCIAVEINNTTREARILNIRVDEPKCLFPIWILR